jgi:hypothetical protein
MCYQCNEDPDFKKEIDELTERINYQWARTKRDKELSDEPRVQGIVYSDKPENWPDSVYRGSNYNEENDFELAAIDKSYEAVELLLQKHHDYGPNNIALSPGGPLNGLTVRLWDKVARLAHLIESGETPSNESLYDTFMDISNYGLIGMLVLDGQWPEANTGQKK